MCVGNYSKVKLHTTVVVTSRGGQGCNSANITLSVINKSNVEQSHNLHLEWVHYSKRILVQIAHDSLSHRKAFHLAQRNL